MRISSLKHLAVTALALSVLGACSSSTDPGAIGINRRQLLLVSSQTMENAASKSFSELNQKARATGALVQGPQLDNLQNIARRLIAQVGIFRKDALNWKWQISLINSKTVNACCMPGGKIVFFTGIIQQLNLTNDEIAAIMGHEIAHALREHSREQASEQVGLGVLSGVAGIGASIAGVPSIGVDLGKSAMNYFITLPHSRRQETEADRMGLELMARAGYNPEAAVNVWRKMQAANKGSTPQFLSTHPSHSTRIKDLQSFIPIVQPLYEDALRKSQKQPGRHQPNSMNNKLSKTSSLFKMTHDPSRTRC